MVIAMVMSASILSIILIIWKRQTSNNAPIQQWLVNNNLDFNSSCYATAVIENSKSEVRWMATCNLPIEKKKSNGAAKLTFTIYHHSSSFRNKFLGTVSLPIQDFGTTAPVRKWYQLQCKPGQEKTDYRGALQIETSFVLEKLCDNV